MSIRKDSRLDFERAQRTGFDEAIFCAGKSDAHLADILLQARERSIRLLLTRLEAPRFDALPAELAREIDYEPLSRTGFLGGAHRLQDMEPRVAVVCAGTSDLFVSREVERTLTYHGVPSVLVSDVGVAGLWRLLERVEELRKMSVIVAVAGMDAALPTVLGGLVAGAIIGVPTSVGYGVAERGHSALNAMLASCSPGIAVMNIDNGYGGACAALRILRVA